MKNSADQEGAWGVLNTTTLQKNLTNTASPQEKSMKQRHRKSATHTFSAVIRSSILKYFYTSTIFHKMNTSQGFSLPTH